MPIICKDSKYILESAKAQRSRQLRSLSGRPLHYNCIMHFVQYFHKNVTENPSHSKVSKCNMNIFFSRKSGKKNNTE